MIPVYVGCAANHEDAESQAVLEWSIRKHASEPVEITWMRLTRDPLSMFYSDGDRGWQTGRWATPFSGFRWAVPHLAAATGQAKAIYVDSDFIFLADIAELFHQPIPDGRVVLARGTTGSRLCISVWNAIDGHKKIPPLSELHKEEAHAQMGGFMARRKLIAPFAGAWNCLDGEGFPNLKDPRLKAIHYTAMEYQPQLRYAIPRLEREGRRHWYDGRLATHWRKDLLALFDELLEEAGHEGYDPGIYTNHPLFGEYRKRRFAGRMPRAPRR